MVWLLVRHEVEDYERWKPEFDASVGWLKEAGAHKTFVMKDTCCDNMIAVASAFDTLQEAQAFIEQPRLKEAMKRAGVIGEPEVHCFEVLDEMDT